LLFNNNNNNNKLSHLRTTSWTILRLRQLQTCTAVYLAYVCVN